MNSLERNDHRISGTTSTPFVPYLYSPLTSPQTELRFVRILPGRLFGRIHISLEHRVAPFANTYRCLSYTWGSPGDEVEIFVNDRSMSVRRNLYDFLHEASKRNDFCGDRLWIDAICINQSNNEEKSVQVQRMGQIFEEARGVIVWLGRDTELDIAFDYAQARHNFEMLDCERQNIQLSVNKFHDHPYWFRSWVAQEVILSRELYVITASKELPWDWLLYSHAEVLEPSKRHRMRELHDLRHITKRDIWNVLQLHRETSCSNVRDRIYSILSLVQGSPFRVDYSETVHDLFYRVLDHFSDQFRTYNSPDHILLLLYSLDINLDILRHDPIIDRRASIPLYVEAISFPEEQRRYNRYSLFKLRERRWVNWRCNGCSFAPLIDKDTAARGLICFTDEWGSGIYYHGLIISGTGNSYGDSYFVFAHGRILAQGSVETSFEVRDDNSWVRIKRIPSHSNYETTNPPSHRLMLSLKLHLNALDMEIGARKKERIWTKKERVWIKILREGKDLKVYYETAPSRPIITDNAHALHPLLLEPRGPRPLEPHRPLHDPH